MSQHLVLDNGGVLDDVDILNGERGELSDQDAAEGVGDGGVNADERELGLELVVLVEFDAEVLGFVSMLRCTGCCSGAYLSELL